MEILKILSDLEDPTQAVVLPLLMLQVVAHCRFLHVELSLFDYLNILVFSAFNLFFNE